MSEIPWQIEIPKLTPEETKKSNILISSKEIRSVTIKSFAKSSPGPVGFNGESSQERNNTNHTQTL